VRVPIASNFGILPSASIGPIDAQPALLCTMVTPACAKRSPPMPSTCRSAPRARIASSRATASISPDASPALTNTRIDVVSAAAI
jgi:hypothetical protein